MMPITALGLSVANICSLNDMALGGCLKNCLHAWQTIGVSDWVFNIVSTGYRIPFKFVPTNPPVEKGAHDVLVTEAAGLSAKSAIVPTEHEAGEFIISYFSVTKPRSLGKYRPILNLKNFNQAVKKYKFRMESVSHVREWIKQNAFCVGMDLKDAFLHVPINHMFQKYLKFSWLGQLFKWTVLPFGLRCSPRVLTNVLKPAIAYLRITFAMFISIYLDDMLIQSETACGAYYHGQIAALVLMILGWSLNWEKSNFLPSQQFTHWGFDWDTSTMLISCPNQRLNTFRMFARLHYSLGLFLCILVSACLSTWSLLDP